MGGKNEKGFTLDECFQAYQFLRRRLLEKKRNAAWKKQEESQEKN